MHARLLLLSFLVTVALALPPASHSKLQVGNDVDSPQFVEEVVVESFLNVRAPTPGRQARTNTNLKDGARVAALKSK